MWKFVSALACAASITLLAQSSPFDGIWIAEVPMPGGGEPVEFMLRLDVEGTEVKGMLQIGETKAVAIENGNIRGDVLSFRRNLGEGAGSILFLARVLDDGLHVGFTQRPPQGAPPSGGSAKVINFTAKRMPSPH